MKLLVDTSVWSLALRRKDAASLSTGEQKLKAELVQTIHYGRVAMLGLIRQAGDLFPSRRIKTMHARSTNR